MFLSYLKFLRFPSSKWSPCILIQIDNCYYLVYFKEILRLDDDSSEAVDDQQRPQRSSSSRPTLLSEDNRKSVSKIANSKNYLKFMSLA